MSRKRKLSTRLKWELMECAQEFFPHVILGWKGEFIIPFIPVIAAPDEQDEVLGRLREKREG